MNMESPISTIIGEKSDGIGFLTFNNPDRRNAMSIEMWRATSSVLHEFENDKSIRVVVMRGAGGKAFVSGSDISQFDDQRKNAEQAAVFAQHSAAALQSMAALSKPLIAMIQGYCIGGGVRVAAAADIRIASERSSFGIPAAKLGLGYSFESAEKLVALVGPAVAKDLLFTGRRVGAQEALNMGLINYVVPDEHLEDAVRNLASEIAQNAPLTIRAAKIAVDQAMRPAALRDMALVEASIRACFDSQDYAIGRKAFQEKQPPRFTGA
jgi:enoyl-CoA hydratase